MLQNYRYRNEWGTMVPGRKWFMNMEDDEKKIIERRMELLEMSLFQARIANGDAWVRI